jgi:16S rRNA (guanine527-N7)-methyltransferase
MPAKPTLVDRVATVLAASLDGAARGRLAAWLERLEEWNERIDLTAARTPEELADLMLADALVLAPRIAQGARVVDVGTGAGAPGLALAFVRPDLRVTLVEPLGKRAAFLRTVLGEAGRGDVAIERVRGEKLARGRAWDVAVSRATLPPPQWLALGVTLVEPGGDVWVLLAGDPPPENAAATRMEDVAYTWPLTRAPRHAVRYRVGA